MGQAATKAKEVTAKVQISHQQAKSKPKNNRNVQQQKIHTAKSTGVLALPERKLKHIPTDIFELSNLRTLDLSLNRLEVIPMEINSLLNLKTLKVSSNVIITLPDLSALINLTTLILDTNSIQSIPHSLPPNLTKLSLKQNQLQEIPVSITMLSLLQDLDMSENQLTMIPQRISQLTELIQFTIDQNLITTLPADLADCSSLKILSARWNQLRGTQQTQSIAQKVLATSNIHIMHLEGNPMTKCELESMKGCESFLERRTLLKNKEIHGGLSTDTSLCGLD